MSSTNEKPSVAKNVINWYPGHMAKAKRLIKEKLNLIDIVYELIDARIPYSSKIKDIDDIIKNKKRLLIMTKYDLCDKVETNKWIKYYEDNGYKVLTVDLNNKNDIKKIINITNILMSDIEEKRDNKGLIKRRYRALVIGIPNVGKSTLINHLVGKNVVGVGNIPGFTKQLIWIRVGDNIELLDTPGILWPKFEDQTQALNLASFTAIKEEILPIFDVVEYILNTLYKYYPNILKERYNLDCIDDDIVETYNKIGKRRGCLIKGGEIDYDKVANIIINDIKMNYIKGITFDRMEEVNE